MLSWITRLFWEMYGSDTRLALLEPDLAIHTLVRRVDLLTETQSWKSKAEGCET
jgi:hypothetical protein